MLTNSINSYQIGKVPNSRFLYKKMEAKNFDWFVLVGELEQLLLQLPLQKADSSYYLYFEGEDCFAGRNVIGFYSLNEQDLDWKLCDFPRGIIFSFSLEISLGNVFLRNDLEELKLNCVLQLKKKGMILHPLWRIKIVSHILKEESHAAALFEVEAEFQFFLKNQLPQTPFGA